MHDENIAKLIQEKSDLREQLDRAENNNQAYLHRISTLNDANQAAGDLLRDAQSEIKALKLALEARKSEGSTSHQDSGENASQVSHSSPNDALERFRVLFEAEEGQNLWDPASRRHRKYEKRLKRAWFWWQKRDLVMGCEAKLEAEMVIVCDPQYGTAEPLNLYRYGPTCFNVENDQKN